MSAQTWLIIAIVGFTLSAIALVVAIFMYIKMNIPAVIGDLTGKTVAREIKAMREANVASGDKHPRSSSVNINRGKLTDKVKDEIDDSMFIVFYRNGVLLSETEESPAMLISPKLITRYWVPSLIRMDII